MRKSLIILLFILCSCDQEFVPFIPDSKPVPIVFGLIDTHDSIHTIRLTKTFYGTKDAYELAKDSSKLLYDSVNMFIECLDASHKVIDTLTFHKTYFTPSANGIFNTSKSWYYVSTDRFPSINSFIWCRLKAYIYDSGDSVCSSIIYSFNASGRIEILSPTEHSKDFSVYEEGGAAPFSYTGFGTFGAKIRFRYFEVLNGVKTEKSIEKYWPSFKECFSLPPAKLFMFIRNGIPENPDVDYRVFKSMDILIYGGPIDELEMYNKFFNSDFELYSDITFFDTPSANIINGWGMFYGYTKDSVTDLRFDQKTMDSLAFGMYTKNLKFVRYQ